MKTKNIPGQLGLIQEFLSLRRIALVGVSRNEKDFTRAVWTEFRKRKFDVVPVHPSGHSIDGVRSAARLQEISPPVEAALIMVGKDSVPEILSDCASAGIPMVWLFGIRGPKDVTEASIGYCGEHAIKLIAGFCPMMFFPDTSWFHGLHRFGWKMIGYYPA